jgi:hypothetical protein
MKDRQSFSLPLYESLGKDNPDRISEQFLSPDEIVAQVHILMKGLEGMAENQELPEVIFVLDRGAALLDPIIKILFKSYCPLAKTPTIFHVNIGRSTFGKNGENSPFNCDPKILHDTFINDLPLSTNRILIIDDYSRSGITINKARTAFLKAFPNIVILTRIAFTKIPNWQGNSDYTGLEEYTFHHYMDMALTTLNDEIFSIGLHFNTFKELMKYIDDETIWLSYRYYEILREMNGTLPFSHPTAHPSFDKKDVESEIQSLCSAVLAVNKKSP